MDYEKIKPNSNRWLDLKDLPNEEWRDIKDFEGLYQISSIANCLRELSKTAGGYKWKYDNKGEMK